MQSKDKRMHQLLGHNREYYPGFSYVENRPLEENPLIHFPDGSVDFLLLGPATNSPHNTWLEKLTPTGTALIMGADQVPAARDCYTLDLGQSVSLYFGAEASTAPGTLLTTLQENGAQAVSKLYRHIGEHLRMHKEKGGGLFSNTNRRN